MEILGEKEQQLLLELLNAQNEVGGDDSINSFISGFKLGARIIIESFMEND